MTQVSIAVRGGRVEREGEEVASWGSLWVPGMHRRGGKAEWPLEDPHQMTAST